MNKIYYLIIKNKYKNLFLITNNFFILNNMIFVNYLLLL